MQTLEITTKKCSRCGETKSLSEFYRQSARADGRQAYCIVCAHGVNAAWQKSPAGRAWRNTPKRRRQARSLHLNTKYGLTADEVDELLAEQDGCAVCGCAPSTPVVDHDHETGAVRGITCRNCNSLLGMAGDDPEILRRALAYLEAK